MERTWGLDTWVLVGFSTLPPSQPGYPVIPLTNWHLINPNELFSNFIIHHQELMREREPWLVVGTLNGGWAAQRGRGWSHRLEELALVLTGGEGEAIWVRLLLDSKVLLPPPPAHFSNQQYPSECPLSPNVAPPSIPIHGGVSRSGTLSRSWRVLKSYRAKTGCLLV